MRKTSRQPRWALVGQLLRFGVVGVGNTLSYYLCYRVLLLFLHYLAAHLGAWLLATLGSFVLNCWFVFRVRPTWRRFARFPVAPLTNLVLSTLGSLLFVSGWGISAKWGTLLAGLAAVPFTFLAARLALADHSDPERVTNA